MRRHAHVLAVALAACAQPKVLHGTVEIEGSDSAAGVIVRLLDDGQASTVTGADGVFELPSEASAATVFATARGVSPSSLTVTAREGEPLLLKFRAVGALEGTAMRGGAPNGNAGIAVSVVGGAASTSTDDRGAFRLEVPVGPAVVQAAAGGFATATSPALEVRRGEVTPVEPLVLALTGYGWAGSVVGRVERVAAGGSDGVRVLVEGAGRSTVTADGGWFTLSDVPEGSYTLAFAYDGLVERVPGVVVARGSDGFIVDERLYRLVEKPITLMAAPRIDSTDAKLTSVAAGRAAWVATVPNGDRTVRWMNTAGEVGEAGRLVGLSSGLGSATPELSSDGEQVVWASEGRLYATDVGDGGTRTLSAGFRRAIAGWGDVDLSDAGLLAFDGYASQSNDPALLVVPVTGGAVRTVHRWSGTSGYYVYQGGFIGETLVALTDVNQDHQGILRWWRDGEDERVLGASGTYGWSASPRQRYVVTTFGQTSQVFDLQTGALVHQNPYSYYSSTFISKDDADLFWGEYFPQPGVRHLTFATGVEDRVSDTSMGVFCFEGGVVAGVGQYGDVLAAVDGGTQKLLVGDGGSTPYAIGCAQGRAYVGEYPGQMRPGRIVELPLNGDPPFEIARGEVAPYYAWLHPESGRLWFLSDDVTVSQVTRGTLWVAPFGSGAPVKVLEGALASPPKTSPDGARLAVSAASGLWVVDADGSHPRRLATEPSAVEWLSDRRLVFTLKPPPAPLRFQGGVYRVDVP